MPDPPTPPRPLQGLAASAGRALREFFAPPAPPPVPGLFRLPDVLAAVGDEAGEAALRTYLAAGGQAARGTMLAALLAVHHGARLVVPTTPTLTGDHVRLLLPAQAVPTPVVLVMELWGFRAVLGEDSGARVREWLWEPEG